MKKSDSFVGNQRAATLIADAEGLAARRDWRSADPLFLEAVSLDSSPSSRIAYGVSLSGQERFFEAISVFTPVLDGNDRSAIGVVCHNLAGIYRDVGDFDLARRFQWRATLLQDNSGAADLTGMANDAIAEDRYEVAESLLMAACDLNDDIELDDADGDLVGTFGLIDAAINSPEAGVMTLFSAYRRHQATYDFRGMGIDLLNMASLFGDVRRYRAQRACLMRARRCFERAPAPFSLNRATLLLEQFERMQTVRAFDSRRN